MVLFIFCFLLLLGWIQLYIGNKRWRTADKLITDFEQSPDDKQLAVEMCWLFCGLSALSVVVFRVGEQAEKRGGGSEEQSETENHLGQTRHHRRHVQVSHITLETVIRSSVRRSGCAASSLLCMNINQRVACLRRLNYNSINYAESI